jgi:mannose-6-phosphate isomerase
VVLDSAPDAAIYLGLKPGIDRTVLAREIQNGTLPLCLRRYDPKPGECYFVPAGAIHALGGGTVVLEVQQTSDATFRLYDWGRVDATGRPRALHLDAGLACLKEAPRGAGLQAAGAPGPGTASLIDCAFFGIARHQGPTDVVINGPRIFVGLTGVAELADEGAPLKPGDAVLIPASVRDVRLRLTDGSCSVADIRIPPGPC